MASNHDQKSETELALWMLDRMQDSEVLLGEIRAARRTGVPDIADTAELVGRHGQRLRRLFQGAEEETVDMPASVAGAIEQLTDRDAMSTREELLEKALAAYIEARGGTGLAEGWQSTIELARAEIEGRTRGSFHAGFKASLANAARAELDRLAIRDREKGRDRERDD